MAVDIDDKRMAMPVLNGLLELFSSLIRGKDALGNEDGTFALEE